jgi:hypothetical protein
VRCQLLKIVTNLYVGIICGLVRVHKTLHVVGFFFHFFAYLRNMASRRVRDDSEIVSILDVGHECSSDTSSSDSDCEISNADASESESGTSDFSSVTGTTEVTGFRLLIQTLDQAQHFQCKILNVKQL